MALKYAVGQRVKSPLTNQIGTIVSVDLNDWTGGWEYKVRWDDDLQNQIFTAEVVNAWDLVEEQCPLTTGLLWNYESKKFNDLSGCDYGHKRKTYIGFTESYDYCETCGVKLDN